MKKTVDSTVHVGAWVVINDLMYYNPPIKGFITKLEGDRYFCVYVPSVGAVLRLSFARYLVTPLSTDIAQEDIYLLIELAIETKDKQWFHQLVSKLKSSGQGFGRQYPED